MVYFDKPGPEGQDQVAGERMVEVYFPMDLPRNDRRKRQAFLAYFTAVMQMLFKYFHHARMCYQGPTVLPSILDGSTVKGKGRPEGGRP